MLGQSSNNGISRRKRTNNAIPRDRVNNILPISKHKKILPKRHNTFLNLANVSRRDRVAVVVLVFLLSASLFSTFILHGKLNDGASSMDNNVERLLSSNSAAAMLKSYGGRRSPEDKPIPIFVFDPDTRVKKSNFPVTAMLPKLQVNVSYDFGGLSFDLPDASKGREIRPDSRDHKGKVYDPDKSDKSEYMDNYYAWDDDIVRDEYFPGRTGFCVRPSWQKMRLHTCNLFHESDLSQDSSSYLSNGYWRDTWVVDEGEVSAVMKTGRMKHGYGFDVFEYTRVDALVMEALTSSPRIVDIYGYCASSVLTERFAEELEQYIIPGSGYLHKHKLHDHKDVDPQNKYTVTEKLEIALAMAESIADLHGFKGGVIVHDDIQLCQWLRTSDGTIKLNDFNRAEVMYWDERKDTYCKYRNGRGHGNYRSPEEYADDPIDEKIDVYSMGNNIYALLTGVWVYYDNEDDEPRVKRMIQAGQLPYLDVRYRTRSFGEGALVQIMEDCWITDPDERPPIFQIVEMLQIAIAENSRLHSAEKEEDEE